MLTAAQIFTMRRNHSTRYLRSLPARVLNALPLPLPPCRIAKAATTNLVGKCLGGKGSTNNKATEAFMLFVELEQHLAVQVQRYQRQLFST